MLFRSYQGSRSGRGTAGLVAPFLVEGVQRPSLCELRNGEGIKEVPLAAVRYLRIDYSSMVAAILTLNNIIRDGKLRLLNWIAGISLVVPGRGCQST